MSEEVKRFEDEYIHLQQEVVEARNALSKREEEESDLRESQHNLQREVQRIDEKLFEAEKESQSIKQENEELLRKKISEQRVLKQDISVQSARVGALYDILQDYESEQRKLQLQDIQSQEWR